MEDALRSKLYSLGIEASYMLSTHSDSYLVYEHVGKFLFDEINKYQGISLLNIYVIDERNEVLQQEVICDSYGIMQGYDVIPANSYDVDTIEAGYIQKELSNLFYITFPLSHNNQLVGMVELRSNHRIDDDFLEFFSQLCKAMTVGIYNRLLSRRGVLKQRTIDMINDVTKNIHIITDTDELVVTFARLIAKHMQFDRVSLFLYGEDNKIIPVKCIDMNGKELKINHIPEIPDLQDKPVPLSGLSGYWFPLFTNARRVGAVLFDNIYSAVSFPVWNNDVLLSLCNQFTIAIENIELFKNITNTARRDKLTNLYNRAYLDEMLDELEKELPLSIIMGDANGLKLTNDVFGHLEGDRLLLTVANILKANTPSNAVIARWGGDEFLIVLPGIEYNMAGYLCKKLQIACEKDRSCAVPVSISLGYGTKASENDDIFTVLKKAEEMMYYNKQIEREQFNDNFLDTIKSFLEEHCDEGKEHINALTNLAFKFGMIIGLSDYERKNLQSLCLFHDIGKIGIPEELIKKETALTVKEWEVIKKHSSLGSRIAHTSFDINLIEEEILCHHERWDGTGYPNGKRSMDIPKLSRIFAIIEAYVVMTQGRPYKKACTHEEAIHEIGAKAGSQFDPALAKLFIKAFKVGIGS